MWPSLSSAQDQAIHGPNPLSPDLDVPRFPPGTTRNHCVVHHDPVWAPKKPEYIGWGWTAFNFQEMPRRNIPNRICSTDFLPICMASIGNEKCINGPFQAFSTCTAANLVTTSQLPVWRHRENRMICTWRWNHVLSRSITGWPSSRTCRGRGTIVRRQTRTRGNRNLTSAGQKTMIPQTFPFFILNHLRRWSLFSYSAPSPLAGPLCGITAVTLRKKNVKNDLGFNWKPKWLFTFFSEWLQWLFLHTS